MKPQYPSRRATCILLLLAVTIIGLIFYMKTASRQISEEIDSRKNKETVPMIVPDTTVTPGTLPIEPDTMISAPSDEMSRDNRPPNEAGEEDGYWDGFYDGVAGKPSQPHAITLTFRSDHERDIYRSGYAEGYERGYEEGIKSPKEKPSEE